MFNKTPTLLLKLPYWEKNEARLKAYIRTFHRFTNSEYRLAIEWNKRNFSFSFFVKDENLYPACKIYSCKYLHCKDYVGETLEALQRDSQNTVTQYINQNQRST